METFSEVRQHIMDLYELRIDEPFIISFEYAIPNENGDRRQSIFLAELEKETFSAHFVLALEGNRPTHAVALCI